MVGAVDVYTQIIHELKKYTYGSIRFTDATRTANYTLLEHESHV